MSHSTVRHVRLTTGNLRAMVSWYARVFGMSSGHSSTAGGMQTASRLVAAWSSNDPARPSVTLLSVTGLPIEPRRNFCPEPQRVTLVCATLDDLRGAHERLKTLGIEPVQTVERGASTTFVYEDPDRNFVELKLDVVTQFPESSHDSQASHVWTSNPKSTEFDPKKFIAAREVAMSNAMSQHA